MAWYKTIYIVRTDLLNLHFCHHETWEPISVIHRSTEDPYKAQQVGLNSIWAIVCYIFGVRHWLTQTWLFFKKTAVIWIWILRVYKQKPQRGDMSRVQHVILTTQGIISVKCNGASGCWGFRNESICCQALHDRKKQPKANTSALVRDFQSQPVTWTNDDQYPWRPMSSADHTAFGTFIIILAL